MSTADLFSFIAIALLFLCVIVWPTQLITDNQNRWLRIAAIVVTGLSIVKEGLQMSLIPAYCVAALFAVLLLVGPGASGESSKKREARESNKKKLIRWGLVVATGAAVLTSAFLRFD